MYSRNIERQGLASRVKFRDISAPDDATRAFLDTRGLSTTQVKERMHAVAPDGTLLKNSAAFSELWALMPGWRMVHYFLRLPGATALADVVYEGFLAVRRTRAFRSVTSRIFSASDSCDDKRCDDASATRE